MIDQSVLYLTKGNRETKVVTLDRKYFVDKPILNLIDEALWPCLSTYKGRIFSTRYLFKVKKSTPIYINQELILQPINSLRDYDTTFVNVIQIKTFEKKGSCTRIIFLNNEEILINVSFARFKQYINNCDIINKYAKKQKERGIY